MNSYTILLSSNPSTTVRYLNSVTLNDISNVTLSLSAVDRTRIPISLKIRWGDNSADEFSSNNFFVDYSKQSILDQIQYSINYTILKDYNHIFYPSSTALTTVLSCQLLLTYQDSTSCRFVQPITLYSPSFYSKVGDLSLINSSFVSTDKSLLYTLATIDGSITELMFDTEKSVTN